MRRSALGLALVLVVLGACGSAEGVGVEAAPMLDAAEMAGPTSSPQSAAPYSGPLFVRGQDDSRDITARSGAAGRALQCAGPVNDGHMGGEIVDYGGGSEPRAALAAFLEAGPGTVPKSGYRMVRRTGDRALFAYEVAGRAKVALTVVDHSDDELLGARGPWTGEAWAQCDPAEFDPAADTDHQIGIWMDAAGSRVPTSLIHTRPAATHCWPGALLLRLKDAGLDFVRDPEGAYGEDLKSMSYEANVALPASAVDTGYTHDDWHLWLAEDKRAAFVVKPDGVERWPAITGDAGCM